MAGPGARRLRMLTLQPLRVTRQSERVGISAGAAFEVGAITSGTVGPLPRFNRPLKGRRICLKCQALVARYVDKNGHMLSSCCAAQVQAAAS